MADNKQQETRIRVLKYGLGANDSENLGSKAAVEACADVLEIYAKQFMDNLQSMDLKELVPCLTVLKLAYVTGTPSFALYSAIR